MSTLKEAGASVRRRGFLDGEQAYAFQDDILMAQIGRLMEEAGEFARSCRSLKGPSASELADVVIVCAAIANHLGIYLDAAVGYKCATDEERRGFRHKGEKPVPDDELKVLEMGERVSKLAMKAPTQGRNGTGQGAVYKDFS